MRAALRCYLMIVAAAAVGLLVVELTVGFGPGGFAFAGLRSEHVLIYLLLLSCAAISVEATRRQGEPAGFVAQDLLAAWYLPITLLLPPVYALLAPFPLMALTQLRVRQTALYRRVFTAVAIGLAHATASALFHALTQELPSPRLAAADSRDLLTWAAAALFCAVLVAAFNLLLVSVAVKLSDLETTWSDLFWDRDDLTHDVVELCIGVMIALLCALNPLLIILALVPVIFLQRGVMHRQLSAATRLDPKTGLLNALTLEREANAEIARTVRTGSRLSVMLIDIDRFKDINDVHGHLAGDLVLRQAAATMAAQLREYDLLARFGGDEFALVLPQTDIAEAQRTGNRLRHRLAELAVPNGSCAIRTTVSIGVAELCSPEQDITDLLRAADVALYRAKALGRDKVEVAAGLDTGASPT